MKIEFLGGVKEIGRSAILVNNSILLDYGIISGNPPKFPIKSVDPEAIIVSHGHLDHVGSIPALLSGKSKIPIHWTPLTYKLTEILARDTLKIHGGEYYCPFTEAEIKRLKDNSKIHGYNQSFNVLGHTITFFDAGHIPGSAHILVDDGSTKLLYTGDFNMENQRIVSGTRSRPDADIVISESTYADVEHEKRETLEKEFAESVKDTILTGGTVVTPAFAIGRTQEMMLICEKFDIKCYVDGMGKKVTEIFDQYPNYLKNYRSFQEAKSHASFVDGGNRYRKHIADKNAVIITTSGMLSGGPAMTYIPKIRKNPTNKITLTGYQVEDTPGRNLIETGRAEINGQLMHINSQIEYYDFSAHADRKGLIEFLTDYKDSKILLNHGDICSKFAEELNKMGFNAHAPEIGEKIET